MAEPFHELKLHVALNVHGCDKETAAAVVEAVLGVRIFEPAVGNRFLGAFCTCMQ